MTGAGGGVGMASRYGEAARLAASLDLLLITSVDLIHPQSKALAETTRSASFPYRG